MLSFGRKVNLYFNTLKYLKFVQVYYRFYYKVRNKFLPYKIYFRATCKKVNFYNLKLIPFPLYKPSYNGNNEFNFLNIRHIFEDNIKWDFLKYGKLWTYNLNYFDFLLQKNFNHYDGKRLIDIFIKDSYENNVTIGFEPAPLSIRCLNWIKFFAYCPDLLTDTHAAFIFQNYLILYNNFEYHLMGNHLLENAFSMMFGAYFFRNKNFYNKAYKVLRKELKEQILPDGAHFELSPMYHCLMLHRLLDLKNLLSSNNWNKDEEFNSFITSRARLMLEWLHSVLLPDGTHPNVNDSVNEVYLSPKDLFEYARRLQLLPDSRTSGAFSTTPSLRLKESGYRVFHFPEYHCFVDVGNIGPDYIPGHAHSDTFSFIFYYKSKPIIVDTGISTYEKNSRREYERSTQAHNTVRINRIDQSEVWGGFRVGRRAKIVKLSENDRYIEASHDGYKFLGVIHKRTFTFSDKEIKITDSLNFIKKRKKALFCEAFFHFHPHCVPMIKGNCVKLHNGFSFVFSDSIKSLRKEEYMFAQNFNTLIPAVRIVVEFEELLNTSILLPDTLH